MIVAHFFFLAAALPLAAMAAAAPPAAPALTAEQADFFEKRIRPVLADRCYECHSATAKKIKGGLVLDTRAGVLAGGDSGSVVVPGQPEKSLFIQSVRHTHADLKMPPKKKLPAAQIADLERWVKMGAPDPREGAVPAGLHGPSVEEGKKFWAFQPLKNPAPPKPAALQSRVQTSVDAFVFARLEAKKLAPAPRADSRTLLRRVTYDLTGLPPTPEEIAAFLADDSPRAFERVVDRLLATPAYGERWGRHWLDVARYADTAGCNSDFPVPPAYKYRNWVINAFNADMAFDDFLRRQIAGDLLPAASETERDQNHIATGYLAVARRFASSKGEFHLTLDDSIDNLGKGLLGLSVACARCHDHKYDPLPTEDYYALYGILKSSTYTFPGVEVVPNPEDYIPLGAAEQKQAWRDFEKELNNLDEELGRLQKLTRGARAATNDVPKIQARMNEIRKLRAKLNEKPPKVELAYGVQEGTPADAPVLRKGDPKDAGDKVPRGFLQVLGGQKLPSDTKESGRRELAAWITDAKNPLTARVFVNRVWHWHFGKGLVQTPNDFGLRGKRPTHPELLDHLASRFIADKWSVKSLHRLILLSATYQQASAPTPAAADPNNDLLSSFPRRRLSAEELRDTLLFAGGALDRSMGGEHPFPPRSEWKYTQHAPFVAAYDSDRRSVYLMQQRLRRHPFFETWDGADPAATTGARPLNASPLQALYQLNDPLVHEQSRRFARRAIAVASDESARIRWAFPVLYGRDATPAEVAEGRDYLVKAADALRDAEPSDAVLAVEAWASYARVMFSANELLFVD